MRHPRRLDTRSAWGYARTMHINWELLGLGVGFAFIIEGLPYFLFAEKMPPVLLMMATKRPSTLRALGLCAILCGLAVVALSR